MFTAYIHTKYLQLNYSHTFCRRLLIPIRKGVQLSPNSKKVKDVLDWLLLDDWGYPVFISKGLSMKKKVMVHQICIPKFIMVVPRGVKISESPYQGDTRSKWALDINWRWEQKRSQKRIQKLPSGDLEEATILDRSSHVKLDWKALSSPRGATE